MNAEALIGKTLGTCTLQELVGQGGMGAVFLAQQSRPRRQVAVKVLLPITRLTPNQQAAFLERFRRETDAAASLDHPNILPVHEYGECDGLAYLVMPYVSGGTLRDELEREGQLSFAKVVNYLDQLAAALEVAHGRGVVHRDIKPANILITPEERLLLTDFGLVKVIAEGQPSQTSLTSAGVPLGTPDYMAPEQVIGGDIDARADLYSLGIILYQMVTGKTPFSGNMPMQIAMQQLNSEPPLPRTLREDLPVAVEQVILRAIAKAPNDRYRSAQDLASGFRLALAVSGVQLPSQTIGGSSITEEAENLLFTPRGLFDPSWQTGTMPAVQQKPGIGGSVSLVSTPSLVPLTSGPSTEAGNIQGDIVAKSSVASTSFADLMSSTNTNTLYVANNPYTPIFFEPDVAQAPQNIETNGASTSEVQKKAKVSTQSQSKPRFVRKTGLLRSTENGGMQDTQVPQTRMPFPPTFPTIPSTPTNVVNTANKSASPNSVSSFPVSGANSTLGTSASLPGGQENTGVLQLQNAYSGQGTTTMKLTQSFKVIQVPVAGQPGQFVTGFLPVLSQDSEGATIPTTTTSNLEPLLSGPSLRAFNKLKNNVRVVVLAAAVLLILLGSSTFWFLHAHTNIARQHAVVVTPNATATFGAQATATMQANLILSDSLSENGHNWHVATSGPQLYVFKDNAYHITNNDTKSLAIALLPDEIPSGSYAYSLTMEAVKGDESAIANQFGLVYNFSVHKKNGNTYKSFYIFEVSNTKGGNYQLLRYDDSSDSANGPWSTLWFAPYGKEFHAGHGPNSANTFKVVVNGKKFVMLVNGKIVGTAQDGSLPNGLVGMLVNLDKTEVAFTNLLLTYK